MEAGADGMVTEAPEVRAYYALNRRVYRWLAPWYDLMVWPLGRLRRRVAALAGVAPGSRVLDVATGTGAQAHAFAARGAQVVGVDISDAMLAVARRKHRADNLTFQSADATRLPFADDHFDVSCISLALHEMPEAIRREVVAEMARVTRPAGTVIVVDYALPRNATARALVHRLVELYERQAYTGFIVSDLVALLRGAGLDIDQDRRALLGTIRVIVARRMGHA